MKKIMAKNMKKLFALILSVSICISLFAGARGETIESTPDESMPTIFTAEDRAFVIDLNEDYSIRSDLKMKKAFLNDENDYFLYKQDGTEVILCRWVSDEKQELFVPDILDGQPVKKVILYGVGAPTVTLADGIEILDCYFQRRDPEEDIVEYGVDTFEMIERLNLGKSFTQNHVIAALERYPNLKEIKVSEENEHYTDIDGVIFSKDKKELGYCPMGIKGVYKLPKTTKRIGREAFMCSELKTIQLNNGLKQIGSRALLGSYGIKKITIPKSVKKIDKDAFCDCKNLKKFIIKGKKTELHNKCGVLAKIVAPKGSKAKKYAKKNKLKFTVLK